jgi:hypothetical protein
MLIVVAELVSWATIRNLEHSRQVVLSIPEPLAPVVFSEILLTLQPAVARQQVHASRQRLC